ncbi:hypothetical protein WJX84_006884 [Apatococcus fuscideae]|uniref:Uncharacterized protein n=1 Tax=Apatococcus fuscideae TaxID=2026836 RepID=A0AAW1TC47_9CHLO
MVLPLPPSVQTAAQLDLSDRQTYELEGCHIVSVDLQDIGLMGIGSPPDRPDYQAVVSVEETEHETDEAAAMACRQLGLPVAFSSSGPEPSYDPVPAAGRTMWTDSHFMKDHSLSASILPVYLMPLAASSIRNTKNPSLMVTAACRNPAANLCMSRLFWSLSPSKHLHNC